MIAVIVRDDSCSRGCILHLLGAVSRPATHDDLHPRSSVDHRIAWDTKSSLLCLRYGTVQYTPHLCSRYCL